MSTILEWRVIVHTLRMLVSKRSIFIKVILEFNQANLSHFNHNKNYDTTRKITYAYKHTHTYTNPNHTHKPSSHIHTLWGWWPRCWKGLWRSLSPKIPLSYHSHIIMNWIIHNKNVLRVIQSAIYICMYYGLSNP